MSDRSRVLVGVGALAAELARGATPVLGDVRWELGRTDGRDQYRSGHLPRAVFIDLETELAGLPTPADGRHPLPEPRFLQAAARRWGVTAERPVVVYDAVGGLSAARAWWLLRWAGHRDVRILDGGLAAWRRSGFRIETGDVRAEAGDIEIVPGGMPVIDADGAEQLARSGALLDARAGARFRGESEPIDSRAGHIPGAVSAPTVGNLAADGTFLPDAALRERFAGLGIEPGATANGVGVYCGSGVTAAHEVAALAAIGVSAALYPGSWSQWSADPVRAVAIGPELDH